MSIQVFGKEFNNLHFVARAIDTKHVKEALRQLYVDNDCIVGSDGVRLHCINNEGLLEPGFYQIIKRTKNELQLVKSSNSLEYPNYERLFKVYNCSTFKGNNYHLRFAQIVQQMKRGNTINFKFFEDAEPLAMVKFYTCDSEPVCMYNEYRRAFIMPIVD